MAIQFRWSAFRHGISEERIRHVIDHCTDPIFPGPIEPSEGDRLLFLGFDQHGIALEIVALELRAGGLLVIHAMGLRRKYRRDLERVMAWDRSS